MIMVVLVFLVLPAFQIFTAVQSASFFGLGVPLVDVLNYAASILAFHWMLGNVFLGAKVPAFQRSLPYDKRVSLHIFSSLVIVLAVTFHAINRLMTGHLLDTVTVSLIVVISVLLGAGVLWVPVPGFRRFRENLMTWARGFLSPGYDWHKTLHRVSVLGLSAFLLLHVFTSGLMESIPWYSLALYWLVYGGTVLIYLYSLTNAGKTFGRVVDVAERHGVIHLTLEPENPVKYRNGQFAFLSIPAQGHRWKEHPFSYLSSYEETASRRRVRFAARQFGDFTKRLGELRVGDRIAMRGSFGNFRPKSGEDVVLVGTGIGIVPVLSILKDAKSLGENTTAILAVQTRGEIPDRDELDRALAENPGIDLRILVYEEDGVLLNAEYLRPLVAPKRPRSVYVCSSPRVRDILIGAFRELGFRNRQIQYESFSL